MNGSGGDNQVLLGESMASLSAFLDQKPPHEHDVFGNLENPISERNTSNRGAVAGWFKINFPIRRGLHGRYQVGAGVRGGFAG